MLQTNAKESGQMNRHERQLATANCELLLLLGVIKIVLAKGIRFIVVGQSLVKRHDLRAEKCVESVLYALSLSLKIDILANVHSSTKKVICNRELTCFHCQF